ncbi:MAG TPA: glucan biosynthesis protein [Chthoniobacterales bacterium]|nr:glucan biosynthesis protein [Chthoniobacterales bacterium]
MKIFALLLALLAVRAAVAQEENVFGYRDVVQKAAELSKQPFAVQNQQLSPEIQNLDYDLYRRIRFLPEHSVWPNAPYRLGFFHPGYYYKRRVLFVEIEKDRLRDIPFSPEYFYYDKPLQFSGHEAFVGFKTYVPSSQPGVQDEFMSFLGASYFRAIAKGLHWGLSTRGLGVNTGINGPEEFPDFREFWMRKPDPKDDHLEFYALLDSESLTGGYQFEVQYGVITTIDVKATIFLRKKPEVIVIAPLTSMFYFGGNTVNKPTLKPDYQPTGKTEFSMNKTDFHRREFRPQVHDSDGLLLDTTSGEKLWAPLSNPRSIDVRLFSNVLSYSLVQRDRDINDYLDRESEYHLRPTLTVIPKSDFGPGYVRLLQLPSSDEYSDNIVAGWQPQNLPEAGSSLEFAYQLKWRGDEPDTTQFRVLSTTVRPSPGSNETRFVVEYGKPESGETIPVAELKPYILVGQGGQVKDVQFTPTNRGWLVGFTVFDPDTSRPLDLSCVILRGDKFCSEKWQYLLNI